MRPVGIENEVVANLRRGKLQMLNAIQGHVLGEAQFFGSYRRFFAIVGIAIGVLLVLIVGGVHAIRWRNRRLRRA